MIKFARLPTQPNADVALLALRLIFGFCMAYLPGLSKLKKLFGDEPIEFMNFMGLGDTMSLALVVFAEFLCSILLFFGIFNAAGYNSADLYDAGGRFLCALERPVQ